MINGLELQSKYELFAGLPLVSSISQFNWAQIPDDQMPLW